MFNLKLIKNLRKEICEKEKYIDSLHEKSCKIEKLQMQIEFISNHLKLKLPTEMDDYSDLKFSKDLVKKYSVETNPK